MCGICGIVVPDGISRVVDEQLVGRMRDQMVHRGPDDAGVYVDRGVGLGHRRLSIVDIAHGHQPMLPPDGSVALVYNGEIFNHPDLKRDLEARGAQYRTNCDTETILHLYAAHGDQFVSQCRGMFAIALWDRATRRLLLVRDRFGVKPLYYAHLADGTLLFGSEIKAILASSMVRPEMDRSSIPDFLANYAPSADSTMFVGIRRVPPGCVLEWKEGKVEIRRYWDLRFTEQESASGQRDSDIVEEYRGRLTEAVRIRLMADVPLGAFLSGGIDSAAITALMSKLVGDGVKTFSVAFAERSANEFEYARMVARAFRTEHHEIELGQNDFWRLLPSMIWHEDEPIAHPSSIALYAVAQLASQHVKVVLTGEGSDEMLAGYNRYRIGMINAKLAHAWASVSTPSMRSSVQSIIGEPGTAGVRGKLARTAFGRGVTLDAFYFDNFAVFTRSMQEQLLADETLKFGSRSVYDHHLALMEQCTSGDLLNRMLYADSRTYLHELLMKQDQMSMAASIESRVPFLDHPLTEWVAALPTRFKLRGLTTKAILRDSMRDILPPAILSRKKMGFPVPIGEWLRGPWSFLVDEFLLSERALARGVFDARALRQLVKSHRDHGNHGTRLWLLLNLEIWTRIAFDGEPREIVERMMLGARGAH